MWQEAREYHAALTLVQAQLMQALPDTSGLRAFTSSHFKSEQHVLGPELKEAIKVYREQLDDLHHDTDHKNFEHFVRVCIKTYVREKKMPVCGVSGSQEGCRGETPRTPLRPARERSEQRDKWVRLAQRAQRGRVPLRGKRVAGGLSGEDPPNPPYCRGVAHVLGQGGRAPSSSPAPV